MPPKNTVNTVAAPARDLKGLPTLTVEQTLTEVLESLNGVEQEAIENAYGLSFATLAAQYPNRLAYGLAWIALRRMNAAVNLTTVKQVLTLKDLDTFFAEEDELDQLDPENPESESGKE